MTGRVSCALVVAEVASPGVPVPGPPHPARVRARARARTAAGTGTREPTEEERCDLAAGDAGTLRLHREPLAADELIGQVAAAHRSRAEAAVVHLRAEADPGLWMDADPVRMRQVLGNLVSNALRHTPTQGTVTLSARRTANEAVLTVRDTGDGISPEDLPHVLERFWRAEKSRSRRTGGSGLGLSIVRQFVEAHGGTVTVGNTPGSGAVFTVRLPRVSGPEEPQL